MKKLVVYLMSGAATPELARIAVESGADVIELGFPFSDPLADGPVIRRAAASLAPVSLGSMKFMRLLQLSTTATGQMAQRMGRRWHSQ